MRTPLTMSTALLCLLTLSGCDRDSPPSEPNVSPTDQGGAQPAEALLDCRREAYACAEGFVCVEQMSGGYDCVPSPSEPPERVDMEPLEDQGPVEDMGPVLPPPRCGDGLRNQDSEECDDGNEEEADGCLNSCLIARCGDGITRTLGALNELEECDDGNRNEGDGCLSSCLRPHCGDGVVNREEEECDDGNSDEGDGCLNGCFLARCGDGVLRTSGPDELLEECDDGNREERDDCLNSCEHARCGDGVLNSLSSGPLEECDAGPYNGVVGCTEECVKVGLCNDECEGAMDGVCSDSGYLSDYSFACPYGSDCADCGARSPDVCLEFPDEGTCLSDDVIIACVDTSGVSSKEFGVTFCEEYERCVEADLGSEVEEERRARCVLRDALSCDPSVYACLDEQVVAYCDANGEAQQFTCDSCDTFEGNVICRRSPGVPFSGTLQHEVYVPNSGLTDWEEEPVTQSTSGVMVISYTVIDGQYQVFDLARTNRYGNYTVLVPESPTPDDLILFMLAKYDEGEAYLSVVTPNFESLGEHSLAEVQGPEVTQSGAVLSVYRLLTELTASEGQTLISADEGAGAFYIFTIVGGYYDWIRQLSARASEGLERSNLALWYQQGVDWECGACFARLPLRGPAGLEIDQHIFFSANDEDQLYWSYAVILHELGHWVMAQFGTSPLEGGPHFFNVPTMPGIAWSEGFATLIYAILSDQSIYFTKSGGAFYWFDLKGRSYSADGALCSDSCEQSQDGACQDGGLDSVSEGCVFGSDCSDCGVRSDLIMTPPDVDGVGYPNPDDPLLQMLDENYVASTLLRVFSGLVPDQEDLNAVGSRVYLILEALQSPEVNPLGGRYQLPYTRGYVRHSWELGQDLLPTNIRAYPFEPKPSFPDYLDALRCTFLRYTGLEGFDQLRGALGVWARSLADLDGLIEASILTYPYPTQEPPPCR